MSKEKKPYYRITVLMPKQAFDKVIKLAKDKFRNNRTAAASSLIEKALEDQNLFI